MALPAFQQQFAKNTRFIFVYPHPDPIAFSLGPLHVRWYGLMYLAGFAAAWWLARRRACT